MSRAVSIGRHQRRRTFGSAAASHQSSQPPRTRGAFHCRVRITFEDGLQGEGDWNGPGPNNSTNIDCRWHGVGPEAPPIGQVLDPDFGKAWEHLGTMLWNTARDSAQRERAKAARTRAFELRDRVTEPERYCIETGYYHYVTEDVPKAARKCELWKSTYPRDPIPYNRLPVIAEYVGDYETAVTEAREALRLEPMSVYFSNLASVLVYANRLDEAQQTVQQAFAHKIDSAWPHLLLHWIAHLRSDATAMQREADGARGKPDEHQFLDAQGSIAAIRGRTREALTLVERVNERETSAEEALQAPRTLGPSIACPLAHVGLARAYAARPPGQSVASRRAMPAS